MTPTFQARAAKWAVNAFGPEVAPLMTEPEAHDAHVVAANKVFRASGFTLEAMQFKRPPEALIALKRFNGLADNAEVPFSWGYHPNKYLAQRWAEKGLL